MLFIQNSHTCERFLRKLHSLPLISRHIFHLTFCSWWLFFTAYLRSACLSFLAIRSSFWHWKLSELFAFNFLNPVLLLDFHGSTALMGLGRLIVEL